jgi:hypothetical protein
VVSRNPRFDVEGFDLSKYPAHVSRIRRADERTRTAFPLITSDNSGVAGVCTSLQIPHI